MIKDNVISDIYENLMKMYGPQGWWPIFDLKDEKLIYNKGDYNVPHNKEEQFEIIMGCILAQNTSWKSASRGLLNLLKLSVKSPEDLLKLDDDTLVKAVTPAGFKNQKSNYLRNVSKFIIDLENESPLRKDLLNVKGVGNETCDSILLFAYNEPEFIVDTYTRRFLVALNLCSEKDSYNNIKYLFTENLKENVIIFKEYHSLIVEHGKNYYQKKPYGSNDPFVLKNII